MKTLKKSLAIVLAALMALSVFAMAVSAAVPAGFYKVNWTTEGLSEGDYYFAESYADIMKDSWDVFTYYYNPETGAVKAFIGNNEAANYEPGSQEAENFSFLIKIYHRDIEEDLIAVKTDEDTVEHGDWFIDYSAYSADVEYAKHVLNRYTYEIGAISKKLVLTAKEDGSVIKYFVGDSTYDTYMNIIRVKHEFGEWTITDEGHSAACTFEGCDYVEEGKHVEKAIDYTFATCTVGATYTYQCIYCGKERVDQRPAPGHWWDDGAVTTPATCTEDGVMTFTCKATGCGETKTEPIPAAHAWETEGAVTTPPTCTEAGVRTFECANCDETKTEPVAALGHDWGEWKVTKEATETEKGEKTRTCQREGCDAVETEEIPEVVVKVNFFQKIINFFKDLFAKIKAFFQNIGK